MAISISTKLYFFRQLRQTMALAHGLLEEGEKWANVSLLGDCIIEKKNGRISIKEVKHGFRKPPKVNNKIWFDEFAEIEKDIKKLMKENNAK